MFVEYHFYFSPVIEGIMIKSRIICYQPLIPIFEVWFKYGIGFASYSDDIWWLTELQAFSRSQKIPTTIGLLLRAFKISFINL
jgi:hypothetical protein